MKKVVKIPEQEFEMRNIEYITKILLSRKWYFTFHFKIKTFSVQEMCFIFCFSELVLLNPLVFHVLSLGHHVSDNCILYL